MKPKSAAVGQYIRNHVIPAGMTVTEAAGRLGVGRPALSNLLNGRASLSPQMVTRFERAFGADREMLLQLQASEDRERVRDDEKAVAVHGYVPHFLAIKARDIERWADSVNARSRLPVLLRKLVHATGHDLTRVDFPGFDESERPGWDGWVEADTATAWIPQGASGWEFGTSKNPHRKAEGDYEKRLQLPMTEREQCAFVFVTPRNWPGKGDWAKAKEAQGDGWREVRAYDASDLEQWLEESVAAPIWLAEKEKLPMRVPGVTTLDHRWAEWAKATAPAMTEHIFQPSVNVCVASFRKWLGGPPQKPFVVAADSKEEALAFLHCLFLHEGIADEHYDRAAVFASADILVTLAASSAPFITIAENTETQAGLAALHQPMHCIALCPRNVVHVKPDFALPLLGAEAFHEGLAGMGFGSHDFDRLTRESGRSPTVLRRRLATIPDMKAPPWASEARLLAPMCLLGAWHVHSKADRDAVVRLANCDHEGVEKHIARLRQIEDSPVWSVGSHRGVKSKIDLLFAVAPQMTEADVRDFLAVAEEVLSEADPRLELPETDRWAAAVHGKVRSHSDALRNGILETLVLLSVHGNHLFQDRLGIDVEAMISDLIAQLLTPLAERLQSQERDLPSYAEAAPDRFLSILENDLNGDEAVVLRLLKPVGSTPFEHCRRTGLLWAIECVAWNPDYLSRACVLLAKLSQVEIADNWVNRPIGSLAAILRSWMPQTAAPLDERIEILKMLGSRFPDIAWKLCLGEIAKYRIGMDNYRPRWRSDAQGAGGISDRQDAHDFMQCAVSLLLSRQEHDQISLGDLVENIERFPETRQLEVWDLIDAWATRADEDAVAYLRERIRCCALTRSGRRTRNSQTVHRARLAYERLEPKMPIVRHAWLFASSWVRESADEFEEGDLDLEDRDRRINDLRRAAMEEIWDAFGLDGVLTMIERGNDPWTLGRYAAGCVTDTAKVLRGCLASEVYEPKIETFMRAIIAHCANPAESDLLLDFSKQIDREQSQRLWTCAPFREETWRTLEKFPAEFQDHYWRTIRPDTWGLNSAERTEVVERLIAVGRPLTALSSMQYQWKCIETALLMRLLTAVAGGSTRDERVSVIGYDISKALEALDTRPGVTVQDMVLLEFAFVQALDHSTHGIPNLERLIATSPAVFVEVFSHCFKRDDGGQDPSEWRIADETHRLAVAKNAFHLAHRIARVPGTKDDGAVNQDDLLHWIEETRELCAQFGRTAIGDHLIGQLLSKAPEDDEGVWPCKAVCEGLEAIGTEEVAQGFMIGKYNARGVHTISDEGGDQERELAGQFRRWAKHRRVDYPFTSGVLNKLAGSYEADAKHEDARAVLSKRLNTWG